MESSYDKYWGTGIPLQDDRCLISSQWNTQGLPGTILQQIRSLLNTEEPPVTTTPVQSMNVDDAPP